MARGMVVGEAVVSQAANDAYRDNFDRIFGKDRVVQPGHWSFGSAEESEQARNAPIIADRIHEGTRSPIDGSDIGSRRKRREHMKAHGVEDATDVSPQYLERVKRQREVEDGRARRAAMESAARSRRIGDRFTAFRLSLSMPWTRRRQAMPLSARWQSRGHAGATCRRH